MGWLTAGHLGERRGNKGGRDTALPASMRERVADEMDNGSALVWHTELFDGSF